MIQRYLIMPGIVPVSASGVDQDCYTKCQQQTSEYQCRLGYSGGRCWRECKQGALKEEQVGVISDRDYYLRVSFEVAAVV